jgi:3-oxoacyl-[acyl-carrier protein] reductase
MKTLQNKHILITGSGGELGSVLCRTFAAAGAKVCGMFHQTPPPDCVELSMSVDFRLPDTIRPALRSVEEAWGRIDILINNAGVTCDGLLASLSEAQIHELLGVNLTGTVMACRAVLPGMICRREGCILNISSLAALHPQAGQAVYAASKGAVESLTRALAVEVASRHIRVNALAPGFLNSRLLQSLPEKQRQSILAKIPLRRWGSLEEAAEWAAFLCSSEAAYITGQLFHLDGGMGGTV